MMELEYAVEIEGVSRAFGMTQALDDVTFAVPRGSIFGLLGPNGAGKTTLFSIIARFLKPDTGRIRVLGHDVREDLSALLGRLSILPQDAQFDKNVPLLDQLVYFRMLEGCDKATAREQVRDALAKVGLADKADRGIQVLSHGMSKRVGVAQAFLGDPEVVLLDEPTAGLDPHNAAQVREIVRELTAKEATVVISSHHLLEIEELCDHVAILDKGKLIRTDTVRQIKSESSNVNLGFSRDLTEAEADWLRGLPDVESVEFKADHDVTIVLGKDASNEDGVSALLRAILDKGLLPDTLSRGGSLEELFLSMTSEGE